MSFNAVPPFGPVPLDSRQTSALFEFFVSGDFDHVFLRFIALWHDDETLGGEAPTFQIRAGLGVVTSVDPSSGSVSITDDASEVVGTVSCQRLPQDIFLLSISDIVENAGPWQLRIRNNDPESLRFLGFCSADAAETSQPWMVLGDPNPTFRLRSAETATRTIEVRNWGTAPLTFAEGAGTPLGEDGTTVTLVSRSESVAPHRVGHLTVEARGLGFSRSFQHVLATNDTVKSHAHLEFSLDLLIPGRTDEPDSQFCRRGCGCPEYLPPAQLGGACTRPRCGHSVGDHQPV